MWIRDLYDIDALPEGDFARLAELRRTESAAVTEAMKTWLWSTAVLKTLTIGKAAAYTVANWERLTRFLGDARIPLDNNATERAIRGPVVPAATRREEPRTGPPAAREGAHRT